MIEFKFSDFFYPRDLLHTYLLLRRSEYWTPSRLVRLQSALLSKLLRFCITEVPYYQIIFKEARMNVRDITPDSAMMCLRQVPILNKDTLKETPHLFIAKNSRRFHPKPVTTSGTTGTPLTVYWDRGSNVMEFCCIQRLWRWAKFRPGQSFLDIRSRIFNQDDHGLKGDGDLVYIRNWKVNGLEFNSDLINDNNIPQYYELLLRYKPRLVRGHPQSIQLLVSLLQRNGLMDWRPHAVTTASEMLYDFQRRQIEDAWHVPILDSYGLKEHNVFITQCHLGTYHIYPEYGICEILDDDGNPVMPGQEGWIVATGLHNYAQVLLRYNTGDRATAGNDQTCLCGRTLPSVERILGRMDDCIYTDDGRRYSGLSFAFLGRKGIEKARLMQDNLQTVEVQLVVNGGFDGTEKKTLLDALEKKVNKRIIFDLKIVDRIDQETPGKFKFVVSKVGPEIY